MDVVYYFLLGRVLINASVKTLITFPISLYSLSSVIIIG